MKVKRKKCNVMSKNITELAKEIPGLSINASFADLVEAFRVVAKEHKKELEEIVISEKAETYPTRKQACEILGIDEATAWRWDKKKYLPAIRIGGKVRYRMSDIKKILDGGKKALQNQ